MCEEPLSLNFHNIVWTVFLINMQVKLMHALVSTYSNEKETYYTKSCIFSPNNPPGLLSLWKKFFMIIQKIPKLKIHFDFPWVIPLVHYGSHCKATYEQLQEISQDLRETILYSSGMIINE